MRLSNFEKICDLFDNHMDKVNVIIQPKSARDLGRPYN